MHPAPANRVEPSCEPPASADAMPDAASAAPAPAGTAENAAGVADAAAIPQRTAESVVAPPTAPDTASQPLVSMLLIAYRQPATVGEAIAGALAQTYSPLEIVISDDASDDSTWAAIEAAVAGYAGPHRLRLNRNPVNLGIGAHLAKLASLAQGELLFVAAGDDVSLPTRCERVVASWMASGKRLDLIASALVDIDADGTPRERIVPSDLSTYRDATDWLARPPHVVGAAQAWTRRLLDRFGPLPPGVVAEDLLMVFRAICSGGAVTLDEALVHYRRGGLSRRRRVFSAADDAARLLRNSQHAIVEYEQLLADGRVAGQLDAIGPAIEARLARERLVRDMLGDPPATGRWRRLAAARAVAVGFRLRLLVHAGAPWLLAPWFALKRRLARSD